MTRVAVLGPGGVGGFVAAALARAGVATTVVAREATAAAIADRGLRVRSARLGAVEARPAATARLDDDVDVLVVATRAAALDAALERVAGEPGLVVPLLDGLDHVAALRARFGPRAVVAAIDVDAERVGPGEVEERGGAVRVELAADAPAARPRLAALVDVLRAAELPARLGDGEAPVLWRRLAGLVAPSLATAAHGLPIGPIRDHPRRRLDLEDAVDETVAVARAEGAALDANATLRALWALDPAATTAMARDVAAGREPELDAIAGAVVRRGAAHGLACPAVERLAQRVRERLA
ncbi:MAG: 2-dehydropantoate 2-reductase [Solirubrobacteraceae bacterium]|nr:2-dehydropantoate 2-reductase [Solirubrobacteraceae bacterium]